MSPQERNLLAELADGFNALVDERSGERTLRTHRVQFRSPPDIRPEELIRLREQLNMSRGVFAANLRTRVRTLESWEQGRVVILDNCCDVTQCRSSVMIAPGLPSGCARAAQ